ncbi:hypothetical protein CFN78_15185 [Amycolatopsis antarctica]|uniref:Cysteine dioxygenase n=1 Tax=Amycolatopsis antarctica TaxID=1854586 RepID=A0A263D208_9PSEU|nr:hypothetical protein CFN78_15185 [Amycolatopsis antarctica]
MMRRLADGVREVRVPLTESWHQVDTWFQREIARPGIREQLREHLATLSPRRRTVLAARSRETTTHFAWCLLDEPEDPFSFWLHEYKPQRDWRPGYADSVHNHRYHFCTTVLSGAYRHERYDVTLDPVSGLITSAALRHSAQCEQGAAGVLLAEDYHRIPHAEDGTMTFLIKSRPVSEWSLSYDPPTGTSHRHVPVERRLGALLDRL